MSVFAEFFQGPVPQDAQQSSILCPKTPGKRLRLNVAAANRIILHAVNTKRSAKEKEKMWETPSKTPKAAAPIALRRSLRLIVKNNPNLKRELTEIAHVEWTDHRRQTRAARRAKNSKNKRQEKLMLSRMSPSKATKSLFAPRSGWVARNATLTNLPNMNSTTPTLICNLVIPQFLCPFFSDST
eukprot:CAMPEP_0174254870 /NCGR_PEP_ID=MMETSP0439-20130205/4219_1 /TAXON_ID=0 /ORGANISM="Stereomyxa ramosa, Strain Chinc5" /LENGTH=183 /DNA_ID=CAMNT_0015336747 /DNA_START=95 /DNA_END=646 /DNA_ORIENTATION=+